MKQKTYLMKLHFLKWSLIIGMICMTSGIFGQTSQWKTEYTKDGAITVKSNVAKRVDENGKSVQLVEYVATTTDSVGMQKCIAVMKDISLHKYFVGQSKSSLIATLSDYEWAVYYYLDAPWPMPDSDCAAKMIFSEDATKRTAVFTLIAAPTILDKKDVKRTAFYNVTYTFEDVGSGKVNITFAVATSPVMQPPDWMVRTYFPNGPAGFIRKFLKLAKGNLNNKP